MPRALKKGIAINVGVTDSVAIIDLKNQFSNLSPTRCRRFWIRPTGRNPMCFSTALSVLGYAFPPTLAHDFD